MNNNTLEDLRKELNSSNRLIYMCFFSLNAFNLTNFICNAIGILFVNFVILIVSLSISIYTINYIYKLNKSITIEMVQEKEFRIIQYSKLLNIIVSILSLMLLIYSFCISIPHFLYGFGINPTLPDISYILYSGYYLVYIAVSFGIFFGLRDIANSRSR